MDDADEKEEKDTRKAEPGLRKKGSGSGSGSGSRSSTPPPTLITHLPNAEQDAFQTFENIERCLYEKKMLGMSNEQDEMMVCDCLYDRHDPDAQPCGPDSDCINRAIYIECLADECRARGQCRNQRFAKKQYADIGVVQTEMKGFGLRAETDLSSGSLIYEYIGEVVTDKTFRKRMQAYAEEGIRHFYFMMLQKDEYIDATKKGGIGRFANHSCNPNCEVQKWVVGRRLRMGIFTKRDVIQGEEITFNYNVDRYGHDAQICYCGEPNCVGTIGGKTQTDIGGMSDMFLDALGIMDQVEALDLRGKKGKKSKQMDEDFIPILQPIQEHEVVKVAGAMRQSMENPKMMKRLLHRIKMTEEPVIQRGLMRMHGFGLMCRILSEMTTDPEIIVLALECMNTWKLTIRNKVEDSQVEEPVKVLSESNDEVISVLAKKLLEYWSTIEMSYKIPRVAKFAANLDADDDAATSTIAEANQRSSVSSENRRPVTTGAWENTSTIHLEIAPIRARPLPFHRPRPPAQPITKPSTPAVSSDRLKLDAIIALAQQTVQAAASAPPPPLTPSPKAESSKSPIDHWEMEDLERERKRAKRSHGEDDEAKKEKRLTKLVGETVVKAMSKYKEQMEHDTFKRYAKECTQILVDKEKRGSSYASTRHPTLSDEKRAKMKLFVKEYTHKLLKKLKEKGKLIKVVRPDISTSTSTPTNQDTLMSEMFGEEIATPHEVDLTEKKLGGGVEVIKVDTIPGTPMDTPSSGQ
ncbi:[histone H3]-lysine36 N-trimethyltransferase, partial [Tremellales sp. Uapishka_1]